MFSIGTQKRTSRLFPFGLSAQRTAGGRPKPMFRPQVEMLECRSLPSTASLSLSAPLIGTLVEASSQPASTSVSVVVETTQISISLASPSPAEASAPAADNHAADNHAADRPLQAMTFAETSFAVEVVFQQTLVVLPAEDLSVQSPIDQLAQSPVSAPIGESTGQTAVASMSMSLTEAVVPVSTTGPQGTGTLSASTLGGVSASSTATAAVSAQPRGAVSTLTPSLLSLSELPLVNTTPPTIVVPNYFQTSPAIPAPNAIGTQFGSDLGTRVQLMATRDFAGAVVPAGDVVHDDNREERGPAMPPMVNPPEPENTDPPSADDASLIDDDNAATSTTAVEEGDPETPLVVLGNEGVARVPELAAAVAVFTAGLGLFPVTLPTQLDTESLRRRRRTV